MSADAAAKVLSHGFINDLLNSGTPTNTEGKEPVLQLVHLSPMSQDRSRWKVAFSDGNTAIQGLLSQQCSHLAEQNIISVGCIVRLKQYQASNLKGKWIFIVIGLEHLSEYGVLPKIGNPGKQEVQEAGNAQPAPITGQGFYGSNNTNSVKPESSTKQSLPSRSVGSHHGTIYPIESLSPYGSKWTIKARVTSKTPVKEWHNDRGEGRLFSFNLLDESGEIRATAFNDQCTAYYDMIEEGGVYYISSPCTIKMAQKKFNNLNNDYELTLNSDTQVEKAEDQQDVPQVRYNFTSIADLAQVEKDAVVDAIGVLKEVGDVSQITSKASGRPFHKRELTLVDQTNFSVRLTVWGNTAQDFEVPIESVVAFKGVKVSDFGGRSLSLLSSGTMSANPDVDEAHRLKGWYDAQGRSETFSGHEGLRAAGGAGGAGAGANLKTVEQVKNEQLGMGETADMFDVRATTVYFQNRTFAYPACASPPERKCNKKVIESNDGSWQCDSCGHRASEPQWRYVLNLSVLDHTGQARMSGFDNVGQEIMGMDAKTLTEITQNTGDAAQQWLDATWKTYTFRCRASTEVYNDEPRVRYTILFANPVDLVKDSKRLADIISSYG